jgi:hypothetical protein
MEMIEASGIEIDENVLRAILKLIELDVSGFVAGGN